MNEHQVKALVCELKDRTLHLEHGHDNINNTLKELKDILKEVVEINLNYKVMNEKLITMDKRLDDFALKEQVKLQQRSDTSRLKRLEKGAISLLVFVAISGFGVIVNSSQDSPGYLTKVKK